MKKVLMSYQGFVSEIRDPGEEYEIYDGPDATIAWVDAPDNVTLDWTLEWSPTQQDMVWVERDGGYTNNAVARQVAYGQVGEQLDMLYHELKETGSISQNGTWYQHITMVKDLIDKPIPQEEFLTAEEEQAALENTEPCIDRSAVPSSMEVPAWRRYSGWLNSNS
jgi:hypothetical protein